MPQSHTPQYIKMPSQNTPATTHVTDVGTATLTGTAQQEDRDASNATD